MAHFEHIFEELSSGVITLVCIVVIHEVRLISLVRIHTARWDGKVLSRRLLVIMLTSLMLSIALPLAHLTIAESVHCDMLASSLSIETLALSRAVLFSCSV